MAFIVTKSCVSKIMPLSPFAGKIWREFPPTTMIPHDRGGGGYSECDAVFTAVQSRRDKKWNNLLWQPSRS
jgi:hypothetical protein